MKMTAASCAITLAGLGLPTATQAFQTNRPAQGVLSQINLSHINTVGGYRCSAAPPKPLFSSETSLRLAASRAVAPLSLMCFLDPDETDESESLSDTERKIFGLHNSQYLPQAKSDRISAGLTVGPFGTISLSGDLRRCLDKSILQFDENTHHLPRLQNSKYHHFKQFYFDTMPIALVQGSGFAPVSEAEPGQDQEILTGADLGRAMAKYLSLATARDWECPLMALYCIDGGATTFDAHVDLLQIHGTYSPLDTEYPQPTTPFMNEACLAATQTEDKQTFLHYMRANPKEATDILRQEGTYLPLGEICVFAGRDYPAGDRLGMPHAGPAASEHPRRFLGFHFTESYPDSLC
jgi:hypothetical protein